MRSTSRRLRMRRRARPPALRWERSNNSRSWLDDVSIEDGGSSRLGFRVVRLEVDALARAAFDGVDRCLLVSLRNMHGPVRRVGEHAAAVTHVPDAVLEHDEDVRAMVDAETSAGAAVLIDPHLHGGFLRCDPTTDECGFGVSAGASATAPTRSS